MPPRRTTPANCVTCHRDMRVSAAPVDGTVRHVARGQCQACWARARYVPKPRAVVSPVRPCPDCGRDTRPAKRPDLPGLYRTTGGRCSTCSHTAQRRARGVLPRRPSVLAEDFYFIAADQGVRDTTRIGYTRQTRRVIAARLGVPVATLDQALYRHVKRTRSQH